MGNATRRRKTDKRTRTWNGEVGGTTRQSGFGEAVETEGRSHCHLNRTTEKDRTEGQLSSLCLGCLAAKARATKGAGTWAV